MFQTFEKTLKSWLQVSAKIKVLAFLFVVCRDFNSLLSGVWIGNWSKHDRLSLFRGFLLNVNKSTYFKFRQNKSQ